MGTIKIPAINFQGGGGGAGSALQTLSDAELASLTGQDVSTPNSVLDTYNSEIATLGANTEIITSLARLTADQNDNGTVEHELSLSVDMVKVEGGMVVSMHSAAVQSVSGNDMVVLGDATAIFPDTTKVIIMTKEEQLGRTTHQGLANNDNNIARLEVASTSFDGTETTITLTNLVPALDLTMGIAALDMPDQLRIAPFDWDLEASATGTGAYEDMDITDLHGVDIVRLEGTNFYKLIESLSGTIDKLDGSMSKNGQYGIIRISENTSGNDTYHWYGSADRGLSWFKVSGTKSQGVDTIDEFAQNHQYLNRGQVKVADNGKFASVYFADANNNVYAVYGDLTDTTPAISDVAAGSYGPGGVYVSGSENTSSVLAIDEVDCSWISVYIANSSNNNSAIFHWSAGGSVYEGQSGFFGSNSTDFDTVFNIHITGTSPNHRIDFIGRNVGTGIPNSGFLYEGALNTLTGNTGEATGRIIDTHMNDTYLFLMTRNDSNGNPQFQYLEHGVTTAYSTPKAIVDYQSDNDVGTGALDNKNYFKTLNAKIKTNPLDDKHVFVIGEYKTPTGLVESLLLEIPDVTTYTQNIVSISSPVNATLGQNFRSATGTTGLAQNIAAQGGVKRIRTVSIMVARSGVHLDDASIHLELYDGPRQSSPTLVATSVNTVPVNDLSLGGKSVVHFEFDDDLDMTGVTSWEVVANNIPIDATNKLTLSGVGGSVHTEHSQKFDGATWTQLSSTFDFYCNIRDYWVTKTGLSRAEETGTNYTWDVESCMEVVNSTQIKYAFRRTVFGAGLSESAWMGHPFGGIIDISGTSAKSAIEAPKCLVYNEEGSDPDFDRNLQFNVALAADESKPRDLVTGVIAGTGIMEAGIGIVYTLGGNATEVIDSDFQIGKCQEFNGSTTHIIYTHARRFNIYQNQKFIVEAEIKPDALTGQHNILNKGQTSSVGFGFRLNSDGSIAFGFQTKGSTSVASVVSIGNYYKIRAVGDGDKISLYVDSGSGFVETAYAAQTTGGYNESASNGDSLAIGRQSSPSASYFSGRIGYIKFAKDTMTFAYDGYKDQRAMKSVQCVGADLILAKRVHPGYSVANNYYDAGVSKDTSPLVDSYDIYIKLGKTFAVAGKEAAVKTTMRRGDEAIQSNEQGRMFTWLKE